MVSIGERVWVGAIQGTVRDVQRVGCCGGVSVSVELDVDRRIVYVKPNELRPAEVGDGGR